MRVLFGIVAVLIIYFIVRHKRQSSDTIVSKTSNNQGISEKSPSNNRSSDPLDEMDATQDAAAIWDMIRKSESNSDSSGYYLRQKAYAKLFNSKDSYTCRLLGENIFSYVDSDVKEYLLFVMGKAYVTQIESEVLVPLELAKMVAKQKKVLDYSTLKLLESLLEEKKIYRNEFFKPVWLNNPKIWEQTSQDRVYLIRLKIFLDTASLDMWTNKDGQTLYDIVGQGDGLFIWESLMNKYNTVNEIKGFLSCFSDD